MSSHLTCATNYLTSNPHLYLSRDIIICFVELVLVVMMVSKMKSRSLKRRWLMDSHLVCEMEDPMCSCHAAPEVVSCQWRIVKVNSYGDQGHTSQQPTLGHCFLQPINS